MKTKCLWWCHYTRAMLHGKRQNKYDRSLSSILYKDLDNKQFRRSAEDLLTSRLFVKINSKILSRQRLWALSPLRASCAVYCSLIRIKDESFTSETFKNPNSNTLVAFSTSLVHFYLKGPTQFYSKHHWNTTRLFQFRSSALTWAVLATTFPWINDGMGRSLAGRPLSTASWRWMGSWAAGVNGQLTELAVLCAFRVESCSTGPHPYSTAFLCPNPRSQFSRRSLSSSM